MCVCVCVCVCQSSEANLAGAGRCAQAVCECRIRRGRGLRRWSVRCAIVHPSTWTSIYLRMYLSPATCMRAGPCFHLPCVRIDVNQHLISINSWPRHSRFYWPCVRIDVVIGRRGRPGEQCTCQLGDGGRVHGQAGCPHDQRDAKRLRTWRQGVSVAAPLPAI